ncbi:MAG: hypothetical protein U0795_11130 [Pirellulales bacterium]
MMELSCWQKVAIVVAALDSATADRLLDHLDTEVAQRIRNSVLALESLSPAVTRTVLEEFVAAGPANSLRGHLSGDTPSRRHAMRDGTSGNAASPRDASHRDTGDAFNPWDPQTLAFEQPQVIAAVIATAPPQQLPQILDSLPVPIQADVVRRMAKFGTPRTEVINDVLEQLSRRRAESERPAAAIDEAALARVQQLLHDNDQHRRDAVLGALDALDPALASTLRSRTLAS